MAPGWMYHLHILLGHNPYHLPHQATLPLLLQSHFNNTALLLLVIRNHGDGKADETVDENRKHTILAFRVRAAHNKSRGIKSLTIKGVECASGHAAI